MDSNNNLPDTSQQSTASPLVPLTTPGRELRLQGILSSDARLAQLEQDMVDVKRTLEDHGKQRAIIQGDVSTLLHVISEIKVGFNFIIRLAQILKWFAGLCISITAIWGLLHAIYEGHEIPVSIQKD